MSTHFSLVCAFLLVGLGATGAQQARQPELITNRSVSSQSSPDAQGDPTHKEWADHVMSKFLDDADPESKPADQR